MAQTSCITCMMASDTEACEELANEIQFEYGRDVAFKKKVEEELKRLIVTPPSSPRL
tara:strand:+ start:383 stop:553 length:171 start_codon:yes stop_codon:yes gene_type:complete